MIRLTRVLRLFKAAKSNRGPHARIAGKRQGGVVEGSLEVVTRQVARDVVGCNCRPRPLSVIVVI